MTYVMESETRDSLDTVNEDDLFTLECLRKAPELRYENLFYLYDLACPYGSNNYDGSCFHE